MTLEELERDVAVLKAQVAELILRQNLPPSNASIMSARGGLKGRPELGEVLEFGRYFRQTGELPPDDWNPGDPIPDRAGEE